MTTISPAFADHLAGTCTTLCHCWKLERRDGAALGFTDHDRPLIVDGFAYQPDTGFAQSEARASLGLGVDSTEVEAAISSSQIVEADVDAGLFDGATVATLLVNWRQPDQHAVLRRASIGRITRRDGRFMAELESIAASLDRPNGRILRRRCDAMLGDARCGFDPDTPGFSASGAVVGQIAPMVVSVSGLDGFAPGWFTQGALTWTGGDLAGRMAVVVDHRHGLDGVALALQFDAGTPNAGDAFTITAGCDKRFETCKAKFANALNFRGFPHLPGNDAAYRYVTEGAEFDGKALVE
jgi:uncharacterized phage protein (TIGR02218 family)